MILRIIIAAAFAWLSLSAIGWFAGWLSEAPFDFLVVVHLFFDLITLHVSEEPLRIRIFTGLLFGCCGIGAFIGVTVEYISLAEHLFYKIKDHER